MIQKVSSAVISISQIRAARGLLGWSQTRLAEAANLSLPTVKRYETASALRVSDDAIAAIQTALESAGVDFIPENGGGAGVRLRKGKTSTDHAKPIGPATDAFDKMHEAIETDRGGRKKK